MRSIPSRVICLIGMNDGAFPRSPALSGFDLIRCQPRPGDRSVRDEDRYTFLEAILAAGDRLVISHTGSSIIDNSTSPPSVVVSELVDCINASFSFPHTTGSTEFAAVSHRLHAFSPAYFDGTSPAHFSYSASNARVSRALLAPPLTAEPDFLRDPLPAPPDDALTVSLFELTQFFRGPAEFLLKHRIGLVSEGNLPTLDDTEPFDLDPLASYNIRSKLASPSDPSQVPDGDYFAARGALPPGPVGMLLFEHLNEEVTGFAGRVAAALAGRTRDEPLPFEFEIGKFTLTGTLHHLFGGGLVCHRCAAIKPKDILTAWLSHLVLNHLLPGTTAQSLLVGSDDTLSFSPPTDAAQILHDLLGLYWLGLQRPLPFFPQCSWEYACAALRPPPKARSKPINKAWKSWSDKNGESTLPANKLCFARGNPLDNSFEDLARQVFGPVLDSMPS